LNEIIDALEMLSMTGNFSRSFVNMHTGRVVNLFEGKDFSDVEDEDLEGEWIPDHYASLPDREELNEYEIMETFCVSITNEKIQEDLLSAIQGKGAFGRFKTAIHCHNIEKKWYNFREACLKEKRHGLKYHCFSRCADH
jgi:Uncharacterised protein family (UPF0158)